MSDNYRRNTYNNSRKEYRSLRAAIHKIKNTLSNNANTNEVKDKRSEVEKRGNGVKWTDVANVLIAAILAYFTYKLFDVAVKQTNISEKNIALADSLFQLSKAQFESSNASAKQSSELQKQSVQAQIDFLRENQSQFKTSNEPYLKIVPFINSWIANQPVEFRYILKNYGQMPAIQTGQVVGMAFANKRDLDSAINAMRSRIHTYKYRTTLNTYIAKDASDTTVFPEKKIFNAPQMAAILNKEMRIFIYGKIRYTTMITKSPKQYEFIIEIIVDYANREQTLARTTIQEVYTKYE